MLKDYCIIITKISIFFLQASEFNVKSRVKRVLMKIHWLILDDVIGKFQKYPCLD